MSETDAPRLTDRIRAQQPDDKSRAVLEAAFETFLTFGVKRSSMQDIADRAGMSRAALYLHFKNKDDIFHALMVAYYDAAVDAVTEALAAHTDPVAALSAAFEAQVGDAAERMMDSPHGAELLAAKHSDMQALTLEGEARLAAVYGSWLSEGQTAGRLASEAVGEDPTETGATMVMAVYGLKTPATDLATYRARRARLAALFGRALRP